MSEKEDAGKNRSCTTPVHPYFSIHGTDVFRLSLFNSRRGMITAWKVSKYGVFSGPYFPAFGLNTERYSISLRIQSKCGKIRTRKNSVFGHFSRSGCECLLVVTDYFSGWTQAYATRNKKYKTAAECLLNDFIWRYRMPSNILHDQGGKFENDLFKELGNGGVGITWKVLIFAIFEHFCEIL